MTTDPTAAAREKLARLLCELAGGDPDYLEPGDALGVDGFRGSDPCHYFWREYVENADAILSAGCVLAAPAQPNAVKREWVACPICGASDMRKETDSDGHALIQCVNHACASNGGDNKDGIAIGIAAPAQDAVETARALAEQFVPERGTGMASYQREAMVVEYAEKIATAIAAAEARVREECAAMLETHIVVFGEDGPYLRPRPSVMEIGSELSHFAAAIRAGGGR